MFTGIVEELGKVKAATPERLVIEARKTLEGSRAGDSIAVNGACLTVTALNGGSFTVELMPETRRRTNLGQLRPGDGVNLERALPAGGRFGGHFVQGHVDGLGRVLSLVPEDEAVLARLSAPTELMRYVVEKGFVAVDGVSLTVIERDASSFAVSLVRYTLENTTLGRKRPGDAVNVEVDILAKYLERLQEPRRGITEEFLVQHGFL